MKHKPNHIKLIVPCVLSAFLCFYFSLSIAQNISPRAFNGYAEQPIAASFNENEILFEKGEIISNVLRLKNRTTDSITFTIDISCPVQWKSLHKNSRKFTLLPGDSAFVPVRILPLSLIKGNTKHLISAFLLTDDGQQLSYSYFFASTKKIINWDLTVDPGNIVYFLNGENTTPFSVNVHNNASEAQDILLDMSDIGIGNNAFLTDTTGKIIKRKIRTFTLDSYSDTNFYYQMNYQQRNRNFRNIDYDTYNPFASEDEKKYLLFVKTALPKESRTNPYKKSKRIKFIKLANTKKVNPYSSSVIPLTADLSVYNILQNTPMMNLDLTGNTMFKGGFLSYHTQFLYYLNYLSSQSIKNAPFFLAYTQKKWEVQLGDITGGKGITGQYHINDKHTVGGYLTKGPRLFQKTENINFGLNHNFQILPQLLLTSQYGHSSLLESHINIDGFQVNVGYTIIRQLSVNAMLNDAYMRTQTIGNKNIIGYGFGLNYSELFFKQKLKTSCGFNYTYGINNSLNSNYSYYYSYYSSYFDNGFHLPHALNINLSNTYDHKQKWNITLAHTYYRNTVLFYDYMLSTHPLTITDNYVLGNRLTLPSPRKIKGFSSYLFYDVNRINTFVFHSRGTGVNWSTYDFTRNQRFSANLRTGYHQGITIPDKKNYFFLQFTSLYQHRTLSLRFNYSYGNPAMNNYPGHNFLPSTKYPQLLSLSAKYQLVLPNPRFVVEPRSSFGYSTITGFRFNVNPEIFYFTRGGWKFRFSLGYNYSYNKFERKQWQYTGTNPSSEEGTNEPTVTNNFEINFGIRKEFGIPIPSRKKLFSTTEFIAFTDVNGNKEYDQGEELLENIVIRVDGWEVLTDAKGRAVLQNMAVGKYPFIVFSLVDQKGWFPVKEDSIQLYKSEKKYVPFSRGVKLYGDVIVDREKYSASSDKQLDLSKIKITANDGQTFTTLTDTKGSYVLYLPYAKYVLTMDEVVLGESFKLVQNNFELNLNDSIDNLYIPFYIIEKKRKIKIKKFNFAGEVEKTKTIDNKSQQQNGNAPFNTDTTKSINKDSLNNIQHTAPLNNDSLKNAVPTTNDTLKSQGNKGTVNEKDYTDMSEYKALDSLVNKMLEKSNSPVTDSASLYKYNASDTSGANNLKHYNDLDSLISNFIDEAKPADSKGVKEVLNIVAESKDFIQRFSNVKSISGFYYTVQVGAFTKPVKPDDFKPISNLLYDFSKAKVIKVLSGMFTNYASASNYLKEVRSNGFPNAFITAYNNGMVISMQEAAKLAKH